MNKTLRKFFAIAAAIVTAFGAGAQMPTIPVDSAVVIGKLPNGLTYYIRHNDYPKGQADFYIAQKVGSIQEEDNQRGLAHFLEHMCFNGTKAFPDNSLVSWLESVGVKFGAHLNAYTSVDETVYNICAAPTARQSVQDSCLLVLHDWANDLLLAPEEIDKERGVIHEEWRRSTTGQMRILEQLLPNIYPGNRYGYRLPIGTMEVVDNFSYQTLRDYYEKWYRPDLQGIFVVGDIDPVRIEAKIKEMFSDIEMPENPAERVYIPVEDTPGTIYAIGRDKEMPNALIEFDFKTDPFPREMKGTQAYLMYDYVMDMLVAMINERFSEMMSNPETPFAYASASYGDFILSKTKASLSVTGAAKGNDLRPVAESVYREILRCQRGGFTVSEYERARDNYLSGLERSYNNRNTRETRVLVSPLVRNFLDNEPIPAIEWLYPQMKQIAGMVTVDMVNMAMSELITSDNRVILAMMPDKADFHFPTEAELDGIIKSVDAETIEAFVDNVKDEPLIPQLPAPGKIVGEKALDAFGAIEFTLSNGVKVYVKQTKFKDDEILMRARAEGGLSKIAKRYSVADFLTYDMLGDDFGIGSYTNSELSKYLTGKVVSLTPSFSHNRRVLSGSSTPKDLATLCELIYGTMTAYNFQPDEFKAEQELYAGLLQNQEANPQFTFSKDLMQALYESPYMHMVTVDDIKNASCESIVSIGRSMMANAADYDFVFVGNIDLDALRPLLEQYIATLPADPATATRGMADADPEFEIRSGSATDTFTTAMETPQTWTAILYTASQPFSLEESELANIAGQILSARLIKKIREEMGAVYSISANGSLSTTKGRNVVVQTAFPMKPEMKSQVLDAIEAEVQAMAGGVTDEELNKVKEYLVKAYTEAKEKNNAWASSIALYSSLGIDDLNGDVERVKAITPAAVADFVKRFLAVADRRIVILDPETKE